MLTPDRLLLTNVRPNGGAPRDVLIENGRISRVEAGLSLPDIPVHDGQARLLLPGFVEAHAHLDKTLLGMPWYVNRNPPGFLERVANERRQRVRLNIDPARQSARQVVQASSLGTTHIRTHVDIDTECRLAGVEGVLATREAYCGLVDMEIVAFPQSGLLCRPGTLELMEEALRLGADVVGGIDPCAMDRDPRAHLDAVFGLAERHGRPIDIHIHEPGELGGFSIELVADRTRALGMRNKVTISHAFCLGMSDQLHARKLIDLLAREGIHVMTLGTPSRPVPSLLDCRAAGVIVCSGSDGIRDTWAPYGNGDMLERAMILGLRNNLRRDDEVEIAFDACTRGGAQVMEIRDYGLDVGCMADLVLVAGECIADAVVTRAGNRTVLKRGRIVAIDGEPVVAPRTPQ